MCGIITIVRTDGRSAAHQVEKQYHAQKGRGQQGFGFVSFNADCTPCTWRQSTTDGGILEHLRRDRKSSIMLFHHRNPTSVPNFQETTHPIEVNNKELAADYYLAHNGSITNSDELFKKHGTLGYEYTTLMEYYFVSKQSKRQYPFTTGKTGSYNDSECLAIEMARYFDGKSTAIDIRGSVAFSCLKINKATGKLEMIYYGCNASSTLKFQRNAHFIMISSEGHGEELKSNILYALNPATGEVTEKPVTFTVFYTPPLSTGSYEWKDGRRVWIRKETNYNHTTSFLPEVIKRDGGGHTIDAPSVVASMQMPFGEEAKKYVVPINARRMAKILEEELKSCEEIMEREALEPEEVNALGKEEWAAHAQALKSLCLKRDQILKDKVACERIITEGISQIVWVIQRLADIVERYADIVPAITIPVSHDNK